VDYSVYLNRLVSMSSARERILESAWGLFTGRGVSGTSMDDVIAGAGVAKQTLYNHFPTKDRLVSAALCWGDERFRESWAAAVRERAAEPAERLAVAIEVVGEAMGSAGYPGCTFLGAAAEDRGSAGGGGGVATEASRGHKAAMRATLAGWAESAGLVEPERVAERVMLLIDGALMTSLMSRGGGAFVEAGGMAREMVAGWPRGRVVERILLRTAGSDVEAEEPYLG